VDKEAGISNKAEEFIQMFKKGEEFTKEILRENEKLRFRVAQLEGAVERSGDETRTKLYEERIRLLELELSTIREKFSQVEEENKDFASKYIEVEEENNNLANLYVASYQLHSTLDFSEVLRIVVEIVINLIGAERFVVMLIDDKTNELVSVATEGLQASEAPRIRIGEGTIGKVTKDGESYFAEDLSAINKFNPLEPIVCIPLKIKEHVIGAIVIYKLLTQKAGFNNVDYELFNLLAGHAATAIFSSRLYTQSERKLTTIQGFLDLLKEKPKR
jgi:transcriptional regulator with GAF, ATPase, and Fis domain